MQKIIQGRVWKFGDDINTDVIAPTGYTKATIEEMSKHVLESVRPEFSKESKPGDILVAGRNFGCGSSREWAPAAIKAMGISVIIAESFARIFFRSAIAIGLPAITCPGISANSNDGDQLKLDMNTAQITNITQGKKLQAQPLPAEMLEVLSRGGIVPMLKALKSK